MFRILRNYICWAYYFEGRQTQRETTVFSLGLGLYCFLGVRLLGKRGGFKLRVDYEENTN